MYCSFQLSLVSSTLRAQRAGLMLKSDLRAFSGRTDMTTDMPSSRVATWSSLPWQGNLKNMDKLPTLIELRELLHTAISAVQAYQESHPRVENLNKLTTRIKRDLSFLESQQQLLDKQYSHNLNEPQSSSRSSLGGLAEGRLQGIVNNLRGLHGELLALHQAPGVIAVCQKFRTTVQQKHRTKATRTPATETATAGVPSSTELQPGGDAPASCCTNIGQQSQIRRTAADVGGSSSGDSSSKAIDERELAHTVLRVSPTTPGSSDSAAAAAVSSCSSVREMDLSESHVSGTAGDPPATSSLCVEVDIVANGGSTWIEVKNQERFSVDSIHWLGSPGHGKGLAQQIADLQVVAAAPVNRIRWRAPEIVVYFPSGVDEGVAAALKDKGVQVAVGPGSLSSLPLPPPAPKVTNLDVTTLCALVSEVSWGDIHSSTMRDWAAKTVHWKDCVAAQIASPILTELHACLDDTQQLVTSCAAVQQFQKLVNMIAGPKEQQRWLQLQQRLQVYHFFSDSSSSNTGNMRSSATGNTCTTCGFPIPECGVAGAAVVSSAYGSDALTSAHQELLGNDVSSGTWQTSLAQQPQPLTYRQPERMSHLDKLTDQQKAILGLGDAVEAITLTANGNAVRYCEQHGVKLEVLVHRPVWLTGI